MTIRAAVPADIPEILALIRELAEYEREPAAAVATAADLLRDGWGAQPRFRCLMAEEDGGAVVGFALYFYNYSTWRGRAGIYVEDLFVRPAYRGRGFGRALLMRVVETAQAEGCGRVEWAVLNWNKLAIDFYEAMGAVPMSEWTTMRLSGDGLENLGAGSR